MNSKITKLAIAAMALATAPVMAVIGTTKDVTAFDHQYDDTTLGNADTTLSPWTTIDATVDATGLVTPTGNNGWLQQNGATTDWGTGDYTNGWTIEVTTNLMPGEHFVWWVDAGDGTGVLLTIQADGLHSSNSDTGTNLGVFDNTGTHTFRAAYDVNTFTVNLWRDGLLVSDTIASINPGGPQRLILGDCCSSFNGTPFQFNSTAFTDGGFAPPAGPTPTAPTITASAATAISAVTATVGGEVTDNGNDYPNVTVYYGTTDGGEVPGSWDSSVDLGLRDDPFTTDLTGLTPSTTYFFRTFGENVAGTDWADTTLSFDTLAPTAPTVIATAGTSTGLFSASLAGEVTDTGNEDPNVTIFYGTADGGTTPGTWDSSVDAGIQSGVFSTNVGGLVPSTTYIYRAFAENSAGGDWADTAAMLTTNDPEGLDGDLDSTAFAFNYEMDENPSGQDLDMAGSAADWFPGTAGGVTIPQTYAGGVAFSNASPGGDPGQIDTITKSGNEVTLGWTLSSPSAVEIEGAPDLDPTSWAFIGSVSDTVTTYVDEFAFDDEYYYRLVFPPSGPPEVLFRTDTGGSIQRESLLGGDFTMEIAVRVISKPDVTDVGIFGVAIDPGGATSSFRLNIDTDEVSLDGNGNSAVATGDNTDAFHVYRIAYNATDDLYWAWRDGVLIYGTDTNLGVVGTNGGFNNNGSFFIGDFTGSLSGEWEVDYIRLNATDVAPAP